MTDGKAGLIRIRKYANRRLYNTDSSTFVTLSDLAQLVKEGREFTVEDATNGADLTSSVLIQIIAEEEAKGEHLLPLGYLRQLIGFYGEDIGDYLTTYLEQTLQAFASNQQQFVDQMQKMFTNQSPMHAIARQNMELFQQTMDTFASLSGLPRVASATRSEASSCEGLDEAANEARPEREAEIEKLRQEMNDLRRRMDDLDQSHSRS